MIIALVSDFEGQGRFKTELSCVIEFCLIDASRLNEYRPFDSRQDLVPFLVICRLSVGY